MNILDRTIGWLSPEAGLRRARARAAAKVVLSYEGAMTGRRTEGWITTGASANVEIGLNLSRLRNRVRDLVRNNSHAKRALRCWVNNSIGVGIRPVADTGDAELNREINAAFKTWSKRCDADGQLDFYGLQRLISSIERVSGECVIRSRIRDDLGTIDENGQKRVPLQFQILEPDYIDTTRMYFVDQTGNYTIYGVQFNKWGERIGYWLFPTHPGETIRINIKSLVSTVIPADGIFHVYVKDRSPQVRGVPDFHSAVLKLRDLDEYGDAEIVRKKIEACLAAFVTQPAQQDSLLGTVASTKTDAAGNERRIEQFEPGMVVYGKPGEDVKFNQPASVGGYREYKTTELHEATVGMGITYEQGTGDLSLVNYSSFKAGRLEFDSDVEAYRSQTLIQMAFGPMWCKFIDIGVVSGAISRRDYGVKWIPLQSRQSIDPEKDSIADKLEVRNGSRLPQDLIAENGYDVDDFLQQYADFWKQVDAKQVLLDTDVRNLSFRGQLHGDASVETGEQNPPPDSK